MDAGDCALAVRGRRLDCVETVPLPGTLTDGAYDLTFTDRTPPGTTEVGRITTRVDGGRALTLHDSPLDQAGLTMEADGALSGDYVMGGDYLTNVAGSAMDQSTPARSRGWIRTFTGIRRAPSRSRWNGARRARRARFGGTWNLSLSGGGFMGFTGTAVLDVTVPADGNAAAAATTLVRSGGTHGVPPRAGTCTVAPAGGVYCMLPVSNPPGNLAVYLHGMLDADGGSGQGAFAIGAAPAMDHTGNLERDALIRQRALIRTSVRAIDQSNRHAKTQKQHHRPHALILFEEDRHDPTDGEGALDVAHGDDGVRERRRAGRSPARAEPDASRRQTVCDAHGHGGPAGDGAAPSS